MNKRYYAVLILVAVLALLCNISDSSAATTTTFTNDQVANASESVQSYVETNHNLPNNVTIVGTTVSMPTLLELESTAITNINNNSTDNITLGTYGNATGISDTLTTGNLTNDTYTSIANNVTTYMTTNNKAPGYESTSLGKMGYNSLVYTFAEILHSYEVGQVLPYIVNVNHWATVANRSTVFINMKDIGYVAGTVTSYVETNHNLPPNVTVSNANVNMYQFLNLEGTLRTQR